MTGQSISMVLFCSFFNITISIGQTTDTGYNKVKAINLDKFVNNTVQNFLNVLPNGYTEMKIYSRSWRTKNKASYLSILYPTGMQIEIKVKKFKYMNPIDINRKWNLELFKKETIFYIGVLHPDYPGMEALAN